MAYLTGVCNHSPLQYWLFTPELQWQSRGETAYLTGVTGNYVSKEAWLAKVQELSVNERADKFSCLSTSYLQLATVLLRCTADCLVKIDRHRGRRMDRLRLRTRKRVSRLRVGAPSASLALLRSRCMRFCCGHNNRCIHECSTHKLHTCSRE